MKTSLACLFAGLLLGCASAPAPLPSTVAQDLGVPAGYALVWSDEFSADGLPDASKWVHDTCMNKQGWHNRELQYYSSPRAENAEVRDASGAFHTYQLHWTAQRIRFGVDGRTHFEYANAGTGAAQWPFDAPQVLILNVAIGGDLGGAVDDAIFPVRMEVDHVRVYQDVRSRR
jgi:beta-glucanase (GH16 family)